MHVSGPPSPPCLPASSVWASHISDESTNLAKTDERLSPAGCTRGAEARTAKQAAHMRVEMRVY